jgi:hypothetical protein
VETENAGADRDQAIERVKKRRDLGGHLVAHVGVNAALWTIWR